MLPAIAPVLLDAGIKSLLVLGVAGLAVICLRRGSAAARHLVWFLAVLALLVLPVLSWGLPRWDILPNWLEARAVQKAVPTRVKPPAEIEPTRPRIAVAVPSHIESELNRREVQRPVTVNNTVMETRVPAAAVIQAVTPPRASFDFRRFATLAWVVGAGLALLPALLGFFSLWLLERKSRRETGTSWLELLRQLMARLKLRRPVALLKTAHRRMPMTWGFLRPRLLLPEESQSWPEERRRVVMLHELAHARRRDYLTNLLTQLACALYWFNPLVWLAARQMMTERERACDDIVLGQGAKPADYAQQILEIAAGLPLGRLAAYGGIPMARPSKLEGRLVAILDAKRKRAALTRLAVFAMLALLAIVVVPVAMMKAASAGGQDATQTQIVFWQTFVDKATAEKMFPNQFASLPTNSFAPIILEGTGWFEALQAAQREGTLEPAQETTWLEPKDRLQTQGILIKSSDLPTEERGGMTRQFSQLMVNGSYALDATEQGAELDLKLWLMSIYQQHKFDQNRFIYHSGGTNSGQPQIKWHGEIADGQALVFAAKLAGDLDPELYQVAIFQAVSAPRKLAPGLRGLTSESRWLANGPDGALAEIKAAEAWQTGALAAATNGISADSKYQPPAGVPIQIVAIGQPGRWPMRWWNLDGQAVKAYPGWQQLGGGMGLGVVMNLGQREGTVDCELRLLDDPPPLLTSLGGRANNFGPGDSASYLGSHPPEQLAQYFDRGGRLELVVKQGVGNWQEIGTIHANETNEADGGRFSLGHLQSSAGGNQVLLDGHFDYDSAYEIAFAAVNKAGKRSPVPSGSGSGQFSQSINRRVYYFTEISKDGVDHFAILKRPVKEFVFTNLPTSPRVPITNSPSVANESTPRENAAGGEATLRSQLAEQAARTNQTAVIQSNKPVATGQSLEFMPDIERVLRSTGALGERCYLDFEGGVATTERTADNQQRNRQLHRDLRAELTPGAEQWTGIGLLVTPAVDDADDLWDAPAEKVIGALADHLAEAPPVLPVTRASWLFKTAEGNYGLMRVEGMVDMPDGGRGMKITYKLARLVKRPPPRNGTPVVWIIRPVKIAAKDLPLPERIKLYVTGEPSTTGYALEIWEQGTNGEMRLRDDLVKLPIPSGNINRVVDTNASITVNRVGGSQQTITVNYSTVNGTGANPALAGGWVYYVKAKNRFYIQWDGMGASTLHYYGPFAGDPADVLGLAGTNATPVNTTNQVPHGGSANTDPPALNDRSQSGGDETAKSGQGSMAANTVGSFGDRIERFVRGAPMTTNQQSLEIYNPIPGTNGSYILRNDVVSYLYRPLENNRTELLRAAWVHQLPVQNRFYISYYSKQGLQYYGPFDGDPFKILSAPYDGSGSVQSRKTPLSDPKRVEPDNPLGLDDDTIIRLFETGLALRRVGLEARPLITSAKKTRPKTVKEMYAAYINRDELARDPFSGGELRLDYQGDAIRFYSVGPDGKWDGGKMIDPADPNLEGDLGAEVEPSVSPWPTLLASGAILDYLKGLRTGIYLAKKGKRYPVRFPLPEWANEKLNYGPKVDGLRAAVELVTTNGIFNFGQPVEVRFHIRNDADYDIQIAGADWRQGDECVIEDEQGRNAGTVENVWYSGWASTQREVLKPGQTAVYRSIALDFFQRKEPVADVSKRDPSRVVTIKPGKYAVRFNLSFDMQTSDVMDWHGVLKTGTANVELSDIR